MSARAHRFARRLAARRLGEDVIAESMSEGDLQESVRQMCRAFDRLYYHTHDARKSPEGFPDATIIVGDLLILRELKTMTGKPTPAQLRWLDALSRVTRVDSGIWRPSDWRSGAIEDALRGRNGGVGLT